MLEKIGKIALDIFEAPGKFLDSLDPKDGHGPEDMGDIGRIGVEKAKQFTKEWPPEG